MPLSAAKKIRPNVELGRSNLSYTAAIPVGYNNYVNLSIKLFVLSIDPSLERNTEFTTNPVFVKYFFTFFRSAEVYIFNAVTAR
jgi:hypothetical protein